MEFGNSLGPFLENIPETSELFDFIEPSLGASNVPLDDVDAGAVRADCEAAGFDGTVTIESFSPDMRLVEHSLSVLEDAFADVDVV
jgi:hypothetical protein